MRHPRAYRYSAPLWRYPSVILTLECAMCPRRKGRYRLARLAHRYGPDTSLDDVFDLLVVCKYHRVGSDKPPAKYIPRCAARFAEWTG